MSTARGFSLRAGFLRYDIDIEAAPGPRLGYIDENTTASCYFFAAALLHLSVMSRFRSYFDRV